MTHSVRQTLRKSLLFSRTHHSHPSRLRRDQSPIPPTKKSTRPAGNAVKHCQELHFGDSSMHSTIEAHNSATSDAAVRMACTSFLDRTKLQARSISNGCLTRERHLVSQVVFKLLKFGCLLSWAKIKRITTPQRLRLRYVTTWRRRSLVDALDAHRLHRAMNFELSFAQISCDQT